MRTQIGKFRIIEQIDPGGATTVYRAEEDLGQDFTRPAAVKILQAVDMDDAQKVAVLRHETGMLLELCSCPNIVTIFGIGIDEEAGPWIAMELLSRSLKHMIGEEPADPDQVRVLLRDTLRALAVVHRVQPPILHRDLKPSNILSTDYGNWCIADFGLARRWEADETLHLATVQYAAPELLDTSLGAETTKMDLYSLGMAAYEFALGSVLYRKQFPSVYDPYADKSSKGDERPKWMYWHTSMQMTLTPIAEIIEDYPTDLSDLIASMTVKPLDERPGSAAEALNRLGRVEGAAMVVAAPEDDIEPELVPEKWRIPALVALVAVVLLVISAAAFVMIRSEGRPRVQLAALYTGTLPIMVTGTIEKFPKGGSATIDLPTGSSFPVYVDDDGGFWSEVDLPETGKTRGFLKVKNRHSVSVATPTVHLERIAPETVQLVLSTSPVVPNAEVIIRPQSRPDEPMRLMTDQSGQVHAEVPYGRFDLSVNHPRYRQLADSFSTGAKLQRTLVARLDEIPLAELYAEMQDLIGRIKRLASNKANCPPGPLSEMETGRLDQHMSRLAMIATDNPDIELFLNAVGRVEECNPESFTDVEDAAANATAAVNALVVALPEDQRGPGSAGLAGAAGGAGRSGAAGGAGRSGTAGGAGLAGIAGLAGAAGGGGLPFLGGATGGTSEAAAAAAAASSNPAVQAIIERLLGKAGAAAVDPVVVARLMAMSLGEFETWLAGQVPTGALSLVRLPEQNKIRLQGVLFSEAELERLIMRLLPALGRLQLEVRIDAWDVCRDIRVRLESMGTEGIRVHAHLAPGDETIFVLLTETDAVDRTAVMEAAEDFVIDTALVRVQSFRG